MIDWFVWISQRTADLWATVSLFEDLCTDTSHGAPSTHAPVMMPASDTPTLGLAEKMCTTTPPAMTSLDIDAQSPAQDISVLIRLNLHSNINLEASFSS